MCMMMQALFLTSVIAVMQLSCGYRAQIIVYSYTIHIVAGPEPY